LKIGTEQIPAFQQNSAHSCCYKKEELNPMIYNAHKHFLEDGKIHSYIPKILTGISSVIVWEEKIHKHSFDLEEPQ